MIYCDLLLKALSGYHIKNKLRGRWWEGKRRDTSRLVRRLLQLLIHVRDCDLDQSNSSRVVKKWLDSGF